MEPLVKLNLRENSDYQIALKLSVGEQKLIPFGVGFYCLVNQ
jgi:hypothetical protein